jgi:hypothetical protein
LIAHFEVVLYIALQQIATLRANCAHHGVLSECECVTARFLPSLRSSQSLSHQRGAEFIDKFGVDLMAILGANIVERWQCLAEGWCKRYYPRGGSNSGGVGSR